jgi:hypothetical protein
MSQSKHPTKKPHSIDKIKSVFTSIYFKIIMNKKIFYRCSCFFQTNIYLEPISKHVHYSNDEQFREEYQNVRNINSQSIQ